MIFQAKRDGNVVVVQAMTSERTFEFPVLEDADGRFTLGVPYDPADKTTMSEPYEDPEFLAAKEPAEAVLRQSDGDV